VVQPHFDEVGLHDRIAATKAAEEQLTKQVEEAASAEVPKVHAEGDTITWTDKNGAARQGTVEKILPNGNYMVLDDLTDAPARVTPAQVAGGADPFMGNTAGAAQAQSTAIWSLKDVAEPPDHWYEYPMAWGYKALRWDPTGWLKNQNNPVFQFFGHHAGEDGIGINKDGSAARISVEEYAETMRASTHSQWMRTSNEGFKQHDVGQPFMGRDARREAFMDRVSTLYEQEVSPNSMSPGEKMTVDAARTYFANFEKAMLDSDLAAARGLGQGTRPYLPHIVDAWKFRHALDDFNFDAVTDLLHGALLKRSLHAGPVDNATRELLKYMAKGYVNGVAKRGTIRDMIGHHGFALDDRPSIREFLKGSGIKESRIDSLLDSIEKPKTDGPARLKQRYDFDMGHAVTARGKDGSMKTLKMTDLFERNLDRLVPMYGRQVAGHIAFAKHMGIKGREDFLRLRAMARDPGVNTLSDQATERGLKYLDYMYDAVTGNPLEHDPGSALSVWGRRIRDFNFIRLMNQVGFAQAVETARVVATVGLVPFIRQLPALAEFRRIAKNSPNGKLTNSLHREMEAMIGIGTFRLRNQVFTGVSNDGEYLGGAFDKMMHTGKKVTSTISGMNFITEVQQKMAAAGMAQRITDMVRKANLTDGNVHELASLGIDEEMAAHIGLEVHANAKYGKGRALHELNLEQWGNQEAANALIMGINRSARRLVQENSYGTSNPFMHSTAGKFLFQFRTFMMNAFFKQTMHGVAMHDAANVIGLFATTLLGGMSYVLQTYANHPDSEKRDELLSPAKIVLAGFNRSGYSSLIPAAADTAIGVASGGTVGGLFSHARASGLSGGLGGIATVDAIDKAKRALAAGPNLLRGDYQFSQADARAISGLLPYQNALGMRRGVNVLMETLPRESTKGTPNAYDLLFK